MRPVITPPPAGKLLAGAIGYGRGVVRPNYAFFPPEGVLKSRLPFYESTDVRFLAAPVLGARFAQFTLDIAPGGGAPKPIAEAGVSHFYYGLEGEAVIRVEGRPAHALPRGGYAYIPPGTGFAIRNESGAPARVLGLRKRYQAIDLPAPDVILSHESDVPRTNHTGYEGRGFRHLLPFGDMRFDFEMNMMYFLPGTFFPAVETHIMEHGLYMMAGHGLYLLGDEWHEIWADDFIWMGAYCPQQFYPTGPDEAVYLLYKDMNRDMAV